MRIPLDARSGPASEHARDGPREPQSEGRHPGIVPTLVDSRTIHAKEAIEILEENFGSRVFASRIRKTVRFAEAPVKGMSVLRYDPKGSAPRPTGTWPRRSSMVAPNKRASMREGPLAPSSARRRTRASTSSRREHPLIPTAPMRRRRRPRVPVPRSACGRRSAPSCRATSSRFVPRELRVSTRRRPRS